jgi:hypothetical protein
MLHVDRVVIHHLSSTRTRNYDRAAASPQCDHICTSLVRHEKVSLVPSISLTIIADRLAYTDVRH